ncbi:hypothetical protein AB0F72_13955 [Actinoplanes sp. NPDC023936]|uniref:hypothetical protein n=1 Tax=Actinoplanes sp. NPDC023936 TaxID=3154910 RepID=UPI0033C735D1
MLVLNVYAPVAAKADVLDVLRAEPSAVNILRGGTTVDGGRVLITADIPAASVDSLLPRLEATGVPGEDISIVHRDVSRPLGTLHSNDRPSWSGGALAWSELAMESRQYARAVPQYLTFMGCAGVIAAFGVLTKSSTLVVGAMAISPDLLPPCAMCVGLAAASGLPAAAILAVNVAVLVLAGTLTLLVQRRLDRFHSASPPPSGT